jgi:hypothetical protein
VSNTDEGIFQCQIQRTVRANEARSERVQLNLIGRAKTYKKSSLCFCFVVPPNGRPRLLLPPMPLKQGQSTNITCLSSPSKPASNLILYKNERILSDEIRIDYQLDLNSNKNLTKIIYTIHDPDSSWDNAIIRCEQIYAFEKNSQRDVKEKIHVYCKCIEIYFDISNSFLIDIDKPKVRIESQNPSPLILNSTAIFRCIVHGNPEPEFR